MFGQDVYVESTKTVWKTHYSSGVMAKPTVDATIESIHLQIWLATQTQHKIIMKGEMGLMMAGTDSIWMDKPTREAMMAGTHHILIDVTNRITGIEIPDSSANLQIVTPSEKNFSLNLKPMMNHLGNGLTLDEKGEYHFILNVIVNGVTRTSRFHYTLD